MTKNENEGRKVVACIGWGSLIWDPGTLPIRSTWFTDGPMVRAEFLRKSSDGRLTLVLHKSVAPVPGLWVIINTDDPEEARTALGEREGIRAHRHKELVGLWTPDEPPPRSTILDLTTWAQSRNVKAVVWTKLEHNFHGNADMVATSDEVIAYLSALEGQARAKAEIYIRNAPQQIDTEYRHAIAGALGWGRGRSEIARGYQLGRG